MFFFYILLEIFIVYLMLNFIKQNKKYNFTDIISSINFLNKPDPCKNIIVRCSDSSDCDKCLKGYSCSGGYCAKHVSDKIVCDESRGVYPVLIKSDEHGVYKCTSIFPLYFDDKGEPYEHICKNGTIDVKNSTDNINCVCNTQTHSIMYIRNIPTCVRNKMLYKY